MSAWGLLAPLINNLSDTYGTGDAANERRRKDAESDTLALERQQIGARVEGAKAAGLHPLAALGFQAGPSAPHAVGQTNFTPDHFRGLDKRDANDPNDTLRNAQIRLINAQADEAEANARRAQYALATQPGNGPPNISQTAVLPTERQNTTGGNYLPGIKVVPNEIQASVQGTTIGTHAAGTDFNIPGGPTIRLPSQAFSQSAEDLDLLKYWAIATMNKQPLWDWVKSFVPSMPRTTTQKEVENLLRRHPPKGVYRSNPRQHGGYVK